MYNRVSCANYLTVMIYLSPGHLSKQTRESGHHTGDKYAVSPEQKGDFHMLSLICLSHSSSTVFPEM